MRKQLRRVCFVLVIVILFCIVVWRSMPRDRMLLRVATPIASAADWEFKDPSMPDMLPYFWLSNQDVLFFRTGPTGGYQLFRQQITPTGHPGVALALPVKEIASTWRPQCLSPDGKWLFWTHWIRPAQLTPMATSLDGSRTVLWQQGVPSPTLKWMPDSQRLAYTNWNNGWQAKVLSLDRQQVQSVSLPGFDAVDKIVALQGVASDGTAIALTGGGTYVRPTVKIGFARFNIDPQGRAPQRISVTVPPGTYAGGAMLSPQGDRLLWSCNTLLVTPIAELLGRIFPAYRVPMQFGHTWWVSGLDGSHLHEIGRIANRDDDGGVRLQWLPDGRQLSFVYKKQLYLVPAD